MFKRNRDPYPGTGHGLQWPGHGDRAEESGHSTKEFWGRRPISGVSGCKEVKVMTHRIERRVLKKKEIFERLQEI